MPGSTVRFSVPPACRALAVRWCFHRVRHFDPKHFAQLPLHRSRNLVSGLSLSPNDAFRCHSEVKVPDLPTSIPCQSALRIRSVPGYSAPLWFRGHRRALSTPGTRFPYRFPTLQRLFLAPTPLQASSPPDQSVQLVIALQTRRRFRFRSLWQPFREPWNCLDHVPDFTLGQEHFRRFPQVCYSFKIKHPAAKCGEYPVDKPAPDKTVCYKDLSIGAGGRNPPARWFATNIIGSCVTCFQGFSGGFRLANRVQI